MMDVLVAPPAWFVAVAIVISVYQGVRGFYFQWVHVNEQNRIAALPGSTAGPQVGRGAIIGMRCIADTVLYLLSTGAGFAALFLAYRLLLAASEIAEISAGAAGLLVFLALFGLLGVTGQLPHLLQAGKFIPK